VSRFPLHELKRLLADTPAVSGIVVSVTGEQARIATPQGLVTARTSSPLSPGVRVLLREGTAYPAASPTQCYPL